MPGGRGSRCDGPRPSCQDQFENNFSAEICSGSEAGSYLRLIYCVDVPGGRGPRCGGPRSSCPPPIAHAALRIVPVTVPRTSHSCEHFLDGFDLHLLQARGGCAWWAWSSLRRASASSSSPNRTSRSRAYYIHTYIHTYIYICIYVYIYIYIWGGACLMGVVLGAAGFGYLVLPQSHVPLALR